MDIASSTSWFADMGIEEPMLAEQEMIDSFDDDLIAALGEDFHNSSFSQECNLYSSTLISAIPTSLEPPRRPTKHYKNNISTDGTINNVPNFDHLASSSPVVLNFSNSSSNPKDHQGASNHKDNHVLTAQHVADGNNNFVVKAPTRVFPLSQTYDHIIAERKRREQLSQRFVALSAIVPGLKKTDKTSVLGDAINYLKQLQEKVKTLEEKATKQTMESVVMVKKSQLVVEDDSSSGENFIDEFLPKIEARMSDKTVLLRIHCKKHRGVLVKIISEIENLNLAVVSTNVLPFGSINLDITLIAEMEQEFCKTLNDLVKILRAAIRCVT